MVESQFKVYDNFGQALSNFDIVAVASKNTLDELVTGIYFDYCLFILDGYDIHGSSNDSTRASLKRPAIFTNDFACRPLNRNSIEMNGLEEDCRIVTVVRIEQPTEDMLMVRALIIDCLDKGAICSNVNRNILKEVIDAARESGRL